MSSPGPLRVAWYALCLQAGWIPARQGVRHNVAPRAEARGGGGAQPADAKAEALRGGLDVMSIAALARQKSGGVVSITS